MKTPGRYTLDINSKVLEKDKKVFMADLDLDGSVGYEYPHFYDNDDKLSSYSCMICRTSRKDLKERLSMVKSIYGFDVNDIYSHKGEYHVVLSFETGLPHEEYKRNSRGFAKIIGGDPIDYHFFPHTNVMHEKVSEDTVPDLSCFSRIYFLMQEKDVDMHMTRHNLEQYNKANAEPIDYCAEAGGFQDDIPLMDLELNMHITYGYPYQYILNRLDSSVDTMKFFNEKLSMDFNFKSDLQKEFGEKGHDIIEGKDFFSDERGYYIMKNGNKERLTDFIIKVHYRLVKSASEKIYIVSLHNENTGESTGKVAWPNTTAKTPFQDYLQKLGNFHFTGSATFIANIHSKISESHAPDIRYIYGYGHHEDLGLIVFKNGIWDVKEQIFTRKGDDDQYFFNYTGQGYFLTDKNGNDLSKIITQAPSVPEEIACELPDLIEFMKSIYKDDSGTFLLMMAMGMLGYMLFAEKDVDKFPMFFVRGITGSGKSTYVDLLQRIFGLSKSNLDFSSSSIFTFTVMLSYLRGFPYFLGEFREDATERKAKVAMLRSNYDKIGQTKGRPDQTIIKYDYCAIPVIDGEEMISDGAVRTRSLQYQFLKAHRIDGDFTSIVREKGHILDRFMYTYLITAERDRYFPHKDEGFKLFKSASTRITENIALIYAGCMAFDPTKKEMWISILEKVLKFQNEDFKENSTSQQIVKAISKWLETNPYEGVFILKGKNFRGSVINWNAFEDYAKFKKLDLTLKTDSYKEHLEAMGYEIGYVEAEDRMVCGVKVPVHMTPPEFLLHPKIYQLWKESRE